MRNITEVLNKLIHLERDRIRLLRIYENRPSPETEGEDKAMIKVRQQMRQCESDMEMCRWFLGEDERE